MAKISQKINKEAAITGILAVFLLLTDRYLKSLAMANFSQNIFGEWLQFNFAPNFGIAFSIPLGGMFLNVFIALIVIALAAWGIVLYGEAKISELMAVMAIILGAISNLADRLAYGYVIDYLDLRYFTVFNLADVLICVGAGWVVWHGLEKNKQF